MTPETHTEHLAGMVEKITYQNTDNGFCIFKLLPQGSFDSVTVVASVGELQVGETLKLQGAWVQHKDFGKQFKAQTAEYVPPSTAEEIERYLGSGVLKGIGPAFAKKLVSCFGAKVLEILENEPEELRRVPGLGRAKIESITSGWKKHRTLRELMDFLSAHGLPTNRAAKIQRALGDAALKLVQENPYLLARDLIGIDFASADRIASNMGIDRNSTIRARAGLNHVLLKRVGDGHCAYPEESLMAEAAKLLQIESEVVQTAIEEEVAEEFLVREAIDGISCIAPEELYDFEVEIGEALQRIRSTPLAWKKFEIAKALEDVKKGLGFELAPLQVEAVTQALENKILIITGGPGTGKTTLTRAILTVLKSKQVRVTLCSPTGRAAKRLSECTGMEAKTIHRLLGFNQTSFQFDQENPLQTDFLLVDEVSMVDVPLMHHLLQALPERASLILIGDVDQIPSVGPGKVLGSLISSEKIPTVKLTQVFRQAAESQIISSAHKMNHGEMPDLMSKGPDSDFHFISSETAESTITKIVEMVKNRIPARFGFDRLKEIHVLTPMNRGPLGAKALNEALQTALNPDPPAKVERSGTVFGTGDKVMVIENDYDKEVFNGDIGFIKSVKSDEKRLIVELDGRPVDFSFDELDLLTLAYATTIHKAQGSEYAAVIVPVALQHSVMLKRNLFYTAVTRGKRLVVLIGQKRALEIAIGAPDQGKRWTNLSARI